MPPLLIKYVLTDISVRVIKVYIIKFKKPMRKKKSVAVTHSSLPPEKIQWPSVQTVTALIYVIHGLGVINIHFEGTAGAQIIGQDILK